MKAPKDIFYDLIYFFFIWSLYFFLHTYSQEEEAFEVISNSYMLFLQVLERFSTIMSMKGWKRLF